ncbi:MAG TPA: hypothetical protein DD732_01510 [Rhizobiales bacterium]|nr:hypothetical protein [Hyphomicrobiales bacterium]
MKNPLAVDPSAKVELQVDALRKKIAAAEAAGVSPETLQSARFVYWAGISWKNPVVTVCFWNGSTELQNFVMKTTKVWSDNSGGYVLVPDRRPEQHLSECTERRHQSLAQ